MFSEYQSLYFAHWLTLAGRSQREISIKMGAAKVDMNPHQIDAALFALKSPVEKGVLLADEVGLGKTIEAGLVMAQRWAERKRKILLIVPASLRKQWALELEEKFELPSIILDTQVAKAEIKAGRLNPFDQENKIVICSYEFVAKRKDLVQEIRPLELVVFDEAHKLRNLYKKDGNKTAKAIYQATLHAESKILLSATPLQNNLMELYGLVKVIDEHFFGDQQSFKMLYVNRRKSRTVLKELSHRLKPIYHRTLRRQVQQEGGINFTNRYSMTEDFTPHEQEWELYQKITDYLQRENLKAMAPGARHLVKIGMHKILASSSFAIVETLGKIIDRLENNEELDETALNDVEHVDEWQDRFDDIENGGNESGSLLEELNELKNYKQLAERITRNAKGEALLKVIDKAFNMAEALGAQRKAVVFTESCRTQRYITELLEANGFANRVVMLNGSNNDPRSKDIYNQWKERHAGSARITGSRTADMKAALVEHFQNHADILVSTEAGGEGINLQFCSLLINYDLPWNPQKVEQRIGRIHRYGQKHDVVIVNFVNRKNDADNRVFRLLSEKLELFEGVFGASDEILGAIVSSDIDIEKRIYQIYQKCKTPEERSAAFDQLDEDIVKAREVREKKAIQTLLQNLDIEVVRRLRHQRKNTNLVLDEYQQMLLNFAQAELPEATFSDKHFYYQSKRYDLDWAASQSNDSEFFRLQAVEHKLAWELIHRVKARQLPSSASVQINFRLHAMSARQIALEAYINQTGLLQVKKLRYHYAGINEEHLLVAAVTNSGQQLSAKEAMQLLTVPAQTAAISSNVNIDLEPVFEQLLAEKKLETDQKLQRYFEEENAKLERWADDRRRALELEVKELDAQIRDMKKAARALASLQEKIDARRAIKQKENERDKALAQYQEAKKKIEAQEDTLLDEIESKLTPQHTLEDLFRVPWTLTR